jgi:hypothetical protein
MKDQNDKRLFVRIPVKFPLKFSLPGTTTQSDGGTVNDLSIRGVGLLTDSLLPCGSSLECWLYLSDKHNPFYAKGEVMWSKQESSNTFRAGISLSNSVTIGLAHVLRGNN